MPIYEYRCNDCGRTTTVFLRTMTTPENVTCRKCGGTDLARLISRVAVLKSEESRMDDLADPFKWGGIDENDPRSMARMMRKMQSEMGEDAGPEFDEMVDKMEAGEMPDDLDGADDAGTADDIH